ncbi:WbqC family protein [Roseburia inulinivorans]|uniref:WbqC-like protein family n=1 Tax=Roseburia inulinivorans TaxID=360807 RepID=A0A173XQT5_9FIRM|nr:WbqC family protein [Roseburia inulinivorans]CUN52945.1 WbqC-like protein family [Roseburia inulinivorans]
MKLGIMQPYFIPYIGYWQLMNAVDKYVIYDDVNFIKGGWINRNRILVNGEPKYFNVPMLGASPYKLINEVGVNNDRKLTDKNLRALEGAYRKAPYYGDVFPLMERVLESGKDDIASYIAESFRIIGEYLDIKTEFIISSDLEKDCEQKGQDKVLSICKLLGATEYYNAIGGQELYSFEDFKAQDITLKFLKTSDIVYEQFGNEFQPNLSIVDVMMFNSREQVQQMLNEYTLITE